MILCSLVVLAPFSAVLVGPLCKYNYKDKYNFSIKISLIHDMELLKSFVQTLV